MAKLFLCSKAPATVYIGCYPALINRLSDMHYPDPSFYLSKILPCRPHHADSATRFSSRMSQRSNDMLSAFVYDIYESAAGIVGILELDHV